jgi:prephenate dehydratase
LNVLKENNIDIIKLDSRYPKFINHNNPTVKFNMDIRGKMIDENVKRAVSLLID